MIARGWLRRPVERSSTTFTSAIRTNVGARRSVNEDRVFASDNPPIWAVVDGMGGHDGGDVAAQLVVDRLVTLSEASPAPTIQALTSTLHLANDEIVARNERLSTNSGATVVAAVAMGERLCVAWAGDSRAYHVRDKTVRLLTRDHSVVQELVDAGLLRTEDVNSHPHSNVVTRALGVNRSVHLDQARTAFHPGDRVILCSDGLSRSLRDGDLISNDDIERLADTLVDEALRRDGSDNISLIILEL